MLVCPMLLMTVLLHIEIYINMVLTQSTVVTTLLKRMPIQPKLKTSAHCLFCLELCLSSNVTVIVSGCSECDGMKFILNSEQYLTSKLNVILYKKQPTDFLLYIH